MQTLVIKKRSGGTRTVCRPSGAKKKQLRKLIPRLQEAVRKACDLEVVHGFAEMRSPVTNAAKHVGKQYTLSFDLKDFFDAVSKTKHKATIGKYVLAADYALVWHNDIAMQGLPTSPIIANIAASDMDKQIIMGIPPGTVYTRYADDLSFSFDDPATEKAIREVVERATKANGFAINEKKTTFQMARGGRRIITGVAVDDGLHPTRASKRRLRAAKHNAAKNEVKHWPAKQWARYVKTQRHHGRKPMPRKAWLAIWLAQRVKGLEEWAKLKRPLVGKKSGDRIVAETEGNDRLVRLAKRHASA